MGAKNAGKIRLMANGFCVDGVVVCTYRAVQAGRDCFGIQGLKTFDNPQKIHYHIPTSAKSDGGIGVPNLLAIITRHQSVFFIVISPSKHGVHFMHPAPKRQSAFDMVDYVGELLARRFQ